MKTLILYRGSNRHSAKETLSKIVLGQFSCFLTEIEITRNTEKIFVDFLLYDEFAHEYGPTHPTTMSTLRLVDRYIKRIVHSAAKAEVPYELILLSDHGQTESIPFDHPEIKSTVDIKTALNNPHYEVIKTYGGITPGANRKELYVVPAGSTLQLYFSDSLNKGLFESEIDMKFPEFILGLLKCKEFGWILVRQNKDSSILYGKSGSVIFNSDNSHIMKGLPFPEMEQNEIKRVLETFQMYCTFPNNGDLVLFGSVEQKKVYSFEKHRGTHGGFYGPMTHPFIMTRNPHIAGDSMTSLFDTIALQI